MSKQGDVDLGRMCFMLSKLDDEQLPDYWMISDHDVEVGLEYFMNLTGGSEIVNIGTFEELLGRMAKRVIRDTGLEEHISIFGMIAIASIVSSEEEAEEKVAKIKELILNKLLVATPLFANALFRFFGEG
jgi:hypothetical protein